MVIEIAKKGIKNILRGRAFYVGAVAYELVLLLTVTIMLLSSSNGSISSSVFTEVYYGVEVLQGLMILLLMPMLASSPLAAEKRANGLEVMVMSKASPFTWVIGEIFCSVAAVGLLFVLGLPFYALLAYYGNASLKMVGLLFVHHLAVGWCVAGFCLFIVSLVKRGGTALCYGFLITLFIILMIIYGVYNNTVYWSATAAAASFPTKLFFSINPVLGSISVLDSVLGDAIVNNYYYGYAQGGSVLESIPLWAVGIVEYVFLGLFFAVLAWLRLRRYRTEV